MNCTQVFNELINLDKQLFHIFYKVDTFVEEILKWADEVTDVIDKECLEKKESNGFAFVLPKTPSEKKTHNKRYRNELVFNGSIQSSAESASDATIHDEAKTIQTRATRVRTCNSKISQFNENRQELLSNKVKTENIVNEKTVEDIVPNTTFSVSDACVMTKSLIQKKNQEAEETETTISRTTRNKVSKVILDTDSMRFTRKKSSSQSKEEKSRNKLSRSASASVEKTESTSPITKTYSETPGSQTNKNDLEENSVGRKKSVRKKISRPLSESPGKCEKRPSKICKSSLSHESRKLSPNTSDQEMQENEVGSTFRVSGTPSRSPVFQSSGIVGSTPNNIPELFSPSYICGKTGHSSGLTSCLKDSKISEIKKSESKNSFSVNKTITLLKETTPQAAATFVIEKETELNHLVENEATPKVVRGKFNKISSTPIGDEEKTLLFDDDVDCGGTEDLVAFPKTEVESCIENPNLSLSLLSNRELSEESDNEISKKKRKVKKEKESFKENVDEVAATARITRTKSKAIKQMMEEAGSETITHQNDLSSVAKKLLSKAKMNSLKKKQLAALLENNPITPKNGNLLNNIFSSSLSSKSKYHLLLSSKKNKTPLATLPNSIGKIVKASGSKDKMKRKVLKRDNTVNGLRSGMKLTKTIEKTNILNPKTTKEDEAMIKRQNVIKSKQEELKKKNEMKQQLAFKQREKLEQEKYNMMVQSEKEKEERHKLILQERQMKQKENTLKKKMMMQQKIAETNERRRLEEEARVAKLKEMEAEEQRIALEKQREQERQEKRAQERLALQKAREEYEARIRQEEEAERIKAEKMMTAKKCMPSASKPQNLSKMMSASKKPKYGFMEEKKEWDYKPRNENDYGLEGENSEDESDEEKQQQYTAPIVPWAKRILDGDSPCLKYITLEMLCEHMPCQKKTPNIQKMFNMTPTKRIKRTSSAIWNTPSS